MPNWVSNTMIVTGDTDSLQAFREQAALEYVNPLSDLGREHLSFWNFVKPDDPESYKDNWYDWNLKYWGCKWDASDVVVEHEDDRLSYHFETPWSHPLEFFQAVVSLFPELDFSIRFLEEQGWGGEAIGHDGKLGIVKEWEIPMTHGERMEYVGYCHCEEMRDDEAEWMHDDCPRKLELAHA